MAIGTFLGLMCVKLVEPHGPLAIKRALNKTAAAGVGEVLLDGPLLHLSIALVGALHRPTWTFVLFVPRLISSLQALDTAFPLAFYHPGVAGLLLVGIAEPGSHIQAAPHPAAHRAVWALGTLVHSKVPRTHRLVAHILAGHEAMSAVALFVLGTQPKAHRGSTSEQAVHHALRALVVCVRRHEHATHARATPQWAVDGALRAELELVPFLFPCLQLDVARVVAAEHRAFGAFSGLMLHERVAVGDQPAAPAAGHLFHRCTPLAKH